MRRLLLILTAMVSAAMPAAPGAEFDVLASFHRAGEQAVAPLLAHADGNVYGTTAAGGAHGLGTVFRLGPDGALTTLVSFGGANGAGPDSGLVAGADGAFYGLTSGGGAGGFGTAFRLTLDGVITTLVSFTDPSGPAVGSVPGGLMRHADGFFYGVTQAGGAGGFGTVFRMSAAGALTTLVEFTGTTGAVRGAAPVGVLVASGSTLYGVTRDGGASGLGTVYRLTTAGVWTLMTEFTGVAGARPGANPAWGLRLHPDGALYGTTEFGGSNDFGTVFRITTAASPVFGSLRSFADPSGSQPSGALEVDSGGALLGVTAAGGAAGLGTLYRLTTGGSHTVLAHFTGKVGATPGASPRGGLTAGGDGFFYGSTSAGGPGQHGLVYRLSATGVFTPVAPFSTPLGWMPSGAPVIEASGALIFPLAAGGAGGSGALVRLPAAGPPAVAAAFSAATGATPVGGLVVSGNSLIGVTAADGASGRGTAYSYAATTGLSLLADFTSSGGALSEGPLLAGNSGDFFGVSREGGLGGHGSVYKLTAAGARTRIVSFTGTGGAARGRRPRGPLAQVGVNFYGVTEAGGAADAGTIFRISPAGVLTTLAEFTGAGPRGPAGGLIIGGDGFLYGTTALGGSSGGGTLIRVDPVAGSWSVVANFSGSVGLGPVGSLMEWAGRLYGQTSGGGSEGFGTVFRYAAGDGLAALVSFTGPGGAAPGQGLADDGAGSRYAGGLVAGQDGHLYGVAAGGGAGGGGTAFRVRLGPPEAPYDAWKSSELGNAGLPDGADPDADGLPILLEYALLLQPDRPDVAGLPVAALKAYVDGSRLHMIVTRDPLRNDVSLLVQTANDLSGPWDTVASSLAGAPFSGPGYVGGDSSSPGLKSVEVRDTAPAAQSVRRFMRLKINH